MKAHLAPEQFRSGVLLLDRAGVVMSATHPTALQMINSTSGRLAFELIHPDDRAFVISCFRTVADGFESQKSIRVRANNWTSDGLAASPRTIELLLLAPTEALPFSGIACLYTDVTAPNMARIVRDVSRRIAVASIDDTVNVIETVFDEAREVTHLTSAALFLPDRRGGFRVEPTKHVLDATNHGEHPIGELPDDSVVVQKLLDTREPLVLRPGDDDVVWNALYLEHLPRLELFVLVPLLNGARCEGILVMASRAPWTMREDTAEFLELSGELVAGALARRRHALELRDRSLQDPLTGLPNRRFLVDRIQESLIRTKRNETWIGLLFVDCDGFKQINDSFGHEAGDRVLQEVAARLEHVCRSDELIARFGGDEFVVMVESDLPENMVVSLGQRIVDALDGEYAVHDKHTRLSASVGVAVHHGGDPEIDHSALFRRADFAMYQAKSGGKNRVQVYTADMETATRDRFELTADLRSALTTSDELTLWFQPVVDVATSTVSGYEALVRWQHPTRGLLLPGSFIGLAEESGQIVELGWHVLESALERFRAWRADGVVNDHATLAVNLSVRQLMADSFQSTIASILRNCGVPAHLVELEVTESVFADRDTVVPRLVQLRSAGAKLSIDDFGTGYSSLAYLRDLPVDILKIDRSFVSRLLPGARDNALVATLIRLAENLSLRTIAEGVENRDQFNILGELRCERAQGFFLGRPAPEPTQRVAGATQSPV